MKSSNYIKGFIPYAAAAFLIGIIGGFSTVLAPAFVWDIGISYSNTTWTALAQAMSTAACAPVLGKLGDVIGRKATLLLGIAVFTLGNIFTAISNSLVFMLISRFIVGIGTAAMTPAIIAYITTNFPQNRISNGYAIYMLISSASVIFGPILGSLIVSAFGWRVMQWVCVVICSAVLLFCLFGASRKDIEVKPIRGFDIRGAVAVLVFFSLLLCVPSFAQNFGLTSPVFIAVMVSAIISLIFLVKIERRQNQPILQSEFIKQKSFIISIIALFLTQGLMQANMTNTIVFVNYTQPDNSIVSGYAISVMYLGMSLGAVILGPLADKLEPKHVLVFSLIITGIGCGIMLLFTQLSSAFYLMSSLGLLGFGLGGNGTIFMKIVLHGLSKKDTAAGTGTYGLFRDLSAPFGVAVFVPLFTNRITESIASGNPSPDAAVSSIHYLSFTELVCVTFGIIAVLFLPKIRNKGVYNEIK